MRMYFKTLFLTTTHSNVSIRPFCGWVCRDKIGTFFGCTVNKSRIGVFLSVMNCMGTSHITVNYWAVLF